MPVGPGLHGHEVHGGIIGRAVQGAAVRATENEAAGDSCHSDLGNNFDPGLPGPAQKTSGKPTLYVVTLLMIWPRAAIRFFL